MKKTPLKLKERLIRDATGSLGLRVAFMTLSFLTSIILARWLGKNGFGVYTYAMTWPALLGIPATLGFDNLLVREVAIYSSQSAWGLMRGLLQWANAIVLIVSSLIALVAIAIILNLGQVSEPQMIASLCVAMISLPVISLTSLRLATMQGLHRVVLGQMPENLLAPLLFIIILTISSYWLLGNQGNIAVWVVGLKVVSLAITFVVGVVLLARVLPQEVKEAKPEHKILTWLKDGLPFIMLGGLAVINSRIDILMLGALKGAGAVGVYAVVSRVTSLIVFALGILNSVLSPTFATLYAEGKREQLQQVVTHSTRLISLFALVMTLGLIALRYSILQLFGAEFIQGQTALIILSIGYLVNALTGSVGLLLNMTRHAKFSAATVAFAALLNVCLNWLLIPKWGVNGAATATAISMIVGNVINAIWVRQKLGIKSTAI
ncbi:flippase [Microcystis aeruginosa]|uniref:flippase n=1 Tax=Microcystis aeruginosa TaxID=1126 RepID=UPI0011EB9520|nr:flippase [Microcystis aeruginosa]TYT69738.1 flippase [Microcystis aeruginosa KLA2]